mgnify:CR=1 FL=1
MKKRTEAPAEFDALAASRVHVNGLRDYAESVGAVEIRRELDRAWKEIERTWTWYVDHHEVEFGDASRELEAAFRKLGYNTAALMKAKGRG